MKKMHPIPVSIFDIRQLKGALPTTGSILTCMHVAAVKHSSQQAQGEEF